MPCRMQWVANSGTTDCSECESPQGAHVTFLPPQPGPRIPLQVNQVWEFLYNSAEDRKGRGGLT